MSSLLMYAHSHMNCSYDSSQEPLAHLSFYPKGCDIQFPVNLLKEHQKANCLIEWRFLLRTQPCSDDRNHSISH